MNPGEYDITIQRGGTFSLTIEARDSIGLLEFTTLYTKARMYIRPGWSKPGQTFSDPPLLELTTENGGITLNVDSFDLYMPATATADISFKDALYEIELVDDSVTPETVDKILKGKVLVEGEL